MTDDELKARHPDMFQHLISEIECSAGWFPLLDDLMTKLEQSLSTLDDDFDFRVLQIKEKFGGLRFYAKTKGDWVSPRSIWHQLIEEAETKSYTICEICGAPGKLRKDRPWIRTLCDEHAK
jgi:hypothetical protein